MCCLKADPHHVLLCQRVRGGRTAAVLWCRFHLRSAAPCLPLDTHHQQRRVEKKRRQIGRSGEVCRIFMEKWHLVVSPAPLSWRDGPQPSPRAWGLTWLMRLTRRASAALGPLTGSCVDSPDTRAIGYTCCMLMRRKAAGSVSDQIRADNVE